jgi:hypothetical protein
VQRWHKNISSFFPMTPDGYHREKKKKKVNKNQNACTLCGGKIQLLTCPSDTIKTFCITVKEPA